MMKTNWNTEQVLVDLRQMQPGVRINWSEFARNHGINAKNGGQIVRDFVKIMHRLRPGISGTVLDF